jgi:hypothetical protein
VIVIQNVDGNVMIQYARRYVTRYARDQNAKSIVKRLNVLSARFTAISHNVTSVVQRIYVRRRIALSVKLSAHQPTVVLNAKHQMLYVLLCAKQPSVTGSARSQSLVLNQSASSFANAQLVIPVLVRMVLRVVAAHAPTKLT